VSNSEYIVSNVTMIIIELERMWKETVVARLDVPGC